MDYNMTKFLKLTGYLLNPKDINRIIIKPHRYHIFFTTKTVDGVFWNIMGFGVGVVSPKIDHFEVCETQHSTDYKIVSDWIKKNS
jgi:hypothetical protein